MHYWTILIGTSLLLAACRADPADDVFARRFLEAVRTGDSAGIAQLDASSPISTVPWQKLVTDFASDFPQGGPPDSVELIDQEWGNDKMGRYRKLTYLVTRGATVSRAAVWLFGKGDTTRVNTLRMRVSGNRASALEPFN